MPRIRSIHPDICDDEVVAELSAYAFRTWVLLWTHLDDDGRGIDNAKLLKGKLYPLCDEVTSERVERDLSELSARGLLIRYESGGRRYLTAKPGPWKRWQKPQHPTKSKLPSPPEPSPVLTKPHESSGGSGVVVEVEGSGVKMEGESEGEPSARCTAARALAARAAARVAGAPHEDPTTANEADPPADIVPAPQPIEHELNTPPAVPAGVPMDHQEAK